MQENKVIVLSQPFWLLSHGVKSYYIQYLQIKKHIKK